MFPETRVALEGGTIYVFSDGLTEACTENGSPLGADGAKRVDALVSECARFELRDELTLLAEHDEGNRR